MTFVRERIVYEPLSIETPLQTPQRDSAFVIEKTCRWMNIQCAHRKKRYES
jgi:hypothetical protein